LGYYYPQQKSILTKTGLANIWAIFFTNSSGHPAGEQKLSVTLCATIEDRSSATCQQFEKDKEYN
jgi:hypothetical protein